MIIFVEFQRSQFFHHLDQYEKARKPTLHLEHSPGEKLFVYFAGKELSYADPKTGEIISTDRVKTRKSEKKTVILSV